MMLGRWDQEVHSILPVMLLYKMKSRGSQHPSCDDAIPDEIKRFTGSFLWWCYTGWDQEVHSILPVMMLAQDEIKRFTASFLWWCRHKIRSRDSLMKQNMAIKSSIFPAHFSFREPPQCWWPNLTDNSSFDFLICLYDFILSSSNAFSHSLWLLSCP